MVSKKRKLLNKADKALSPALRYVAFTKFKRPRVKGTFGPASEVRIIKNG